MTELTLETLAKRVEELERKFAEGQTVPAKGWRSAAGMFIDSEFSEGVAADEIRETSRQ